jgi:pilus assembly protein CpaE
MPILVEADNTTAGILSAALPVGSQVVARADEVDGLLNGRGDFAVILGPTLELSVASAIAEQVRSTHPSTSVVLIRHQLAPEVFAQAMQVGIGAVVAADDQVSLSSAISRARSTWEAINGPTVSDGEGDRNGRVFTVFSPKGGVGKTTMAVNLGVALSMAGSRVCVVDLDLAFGDVAITMQLIPEHTIAEAADSEEDLDYSMLQTLLTHHTSGLSILAAPTHPEGRDRISSSLVRRVIQNMRNNFDFIIIDTPPGFDDQVLGAFDETDECVIVATLDVPTIKNTKVAIETLDLLNLVRNNRHLVLNRADEEVGLSLANVEEILGMKVSVALPSATAVASATNHGEPIVLSNPGHPVSKAINALAHQVTGDLVGAKASEPVKRGLFGRQKKH